MEAFQAVCGRETPSGGNTDIDNTLQERDNPKGIIGPL